MCVYVCVYVCVCVWMCMWMCIYVYVYVYVYVHVYVYVLIGGIRLYSRSRRAWGRAASRHCYIVYEVFIRR
jgi:hypothetical protein